MSELEQAIASAMDRARQEPRTETEVRTPADRRARELAAARLRQQADQLAPVDTEEGAA